MEIVIGLILGLLAGAAVGYVVRKALAEREVDSAEARAKTISRPRAGGRGEQTRGPRRGQGGGSRLRRRPRPT